MDLKLSSSHLSNVETGLPKGDWDVGISLDMVEYARKADVLVLASGDGDFTSVVEKVLGEHEVRVDIYGVLELTAFSLKQAATSFVPINEVSSKSV